LVDSPEAIDPLDVVALEPQEAITKVTARRPMIL
jgi:hypothetical protein